MSRESRRVKLTPSHVRNLPAVDGRTTEYSDLLRPGLRLKVTSDGARVWLFAYRRPDGRSAKFRIGPVGKDLDLAFARARVGQLALQVGNGEDPQGARVEARRRSEAPTVETLAALWIATKSREWRPATLAEKQHYVRAEINPQIGHIDPRKLTVLDVRRMLVRLRDGVRSADGSWSREPAEVSANRLHSTCKALFAWAVERGHMEENPALKIQRLYKETERAVFLSSDEVKRMFAALAPEPETVRDLFTLVAFCGTRNTETRTMRWTDVDFDRELWTIPAESHKTGEVVRDRPVPLSGPALALLLRRRQAAQAETVQSMFVFPDASNPGRPLPQIGYVLVRVRERAGIEEATLHDLRRVMRNAMQDAGVDADVAERCLGHLPPKLMRTYAKPWPLVRMREALDLWATVLSDMLVNTIDVSTAQR
jgi:integrase